MPHPRRLLVGQRDVVGRAGMAHRPSGPRRPPGDRPGHAGAVRRAAILEHIIHGYAQAAPLAHGWRSRVPLHQLHPLLVHVCLFGAGYRDAALAAARAALSS